MNATTLDRYAVMGYPITQSLSPFIHARFAAQTGEQLSYTRQAVAPEDFEREVRAFFASGGQGLNITVPHKQAASLLAEQLTDRARLAGAVNTLKPQPQGLLGDNTDGVGLLTDLTRNLRYDLAGRRVLLLGAGGAARGVLGPLLLAGPARLTVANRTAARARTLAEQFAALGPVEGQALQDIDIEVPFDLIVNATSASLHDEVPPLPREAVVEDTLCYDLAYGRPDTAFTRWARSAGSRHTAMGLGMLVEQAAEAFQVWRGVRPDTRPVLEALLAGEGWD